MTVSTTTTSSEKWRLGEAQGTVGKLRQFLLLSRVPRGQLIGKDRMFLLYSEVWLVILWVVMKISRSMLLRVKSNEAMKKRTRKQGKTKKKADKLDALKPKKPPTAFFYFLCVFIVLVYSFCLSSLLFQVQFWIIHSWI